MTGAGRDPRRAADPFAVLGLNLVADVSDDDVRSAWRRIAAATHPDRADGGDPERFALAAAAYTELRTPSGRGEARAATTQARPARSRAAGRHRAKPARGTSAADASRWLARQWARVRHGRPGRLALRVLGAATAATLAVLAAGQRPAAPALAVGILTWLLVTARHDLG